jgi:N12 class adenine-specific DNA methylase
MPIVMKSGSFKASDPFGLYRNRQNPFEAPAAPQLSPEEEQRNAEIARVQQTNAATEAQFGTLSEAEPDRYELIDESALGQWQSDWQARQPGWLEDTARLMGGALAKGSGAVVGGLGNAITGLTNATTTPLINQIFGTEYGQANPLGAPAEWINTLGEKTQEGMSFATREAIANSTPGGDLLDPSTWTLGEDPSAVGYAALALDVFGQMTPVIAASIIAGPAGGAVVGGLQGGGAGAQQAEALIDQMAAEPGVLERESAYYREQIAAGRSHEEALAATKAAAAQAAFALTAPISALGGFATGKIIDPATAVLAGRNIVTRIAGRAGLSGLEEGAQEAAESAASTMGTNLGAGTDLSLTDGTFADFLLGALGGSVPGAAAGALSQREEMAPPSDMPVPNADMSAPVPGTGPATPDMPAPQPTPKGPLSRAVETGLANAPTDPSAGARYIVNDPALPGMGAGAAHGQLVTMAPDQRGIDPGMARVVLEDGTERVLGKRLLQSEQGAPMVPDPQATTAPLTVTPQGAGGLPDAGSRVMVAAPDLEPFNATVEQYITHEDGSREALVVDDNGEVLQVPLSAVSSLNLSRREVEALERADNPPPPPAEPSPETRPLLRDLQNEVGEPTTLKFPDEVSARLFDYGRERTAFNRMARTMGESALDIQATTFKPDVAKALAAELGISPEGLAEVADDYRYRVERAARKGTAEAVSKMHAVNPEVLARWRTTETAASETEAETLAPDGDADAAWWDGLQPGARKALLAAAKVKRSEKSTWDKFSKQIKAKLAPLRAEMEGLDKARARSQALDSGLPDPEPDDSQADYTRWREGQESQLSALENGTDPLTADDEANIRRIASNLASETNFPDEADFVADRAVERARANRAALDDAADEAATSPANDRPEPSEAQKEAGNYKLGHHRIGGLDLSIENPAGSERKGQDKTGKPWSVTMKSHYGYIRGTVGKDKDHIDVFVKPGTEALDDTAMVTVVNQVNEAGQFDEHKVMLGFKSQSEAEAAYMENYTKGWKGLGSVGIATLGSFKSWLKDGDTTKPFSPNTVAPEASSEKTRRELTGTDQAAKPFAREELYRDVANMLRRNRALDPISALVAVDAKGSEILDAFDKHVGQHMAGSGGDRTSFQARGRKLEVLMPSADGKEPVRKTFQGGDLVTLLRNAVEAVHTAKAPEAGAVGSRGQSSTDSSAPDAALWDDPSYDTDREAAKAFKAGDRVEYTNGNFDPPRVFTGRVKKKQFRGFKPMGLLEVEVDGARDGGTHDVTIAASQLRAAPKERTSAPPAKAQEPDEAAVAPAEPEGKPTPDPFAKNKLFTADKVAAAKARLKSKMGQLNSGIDPEVLVDGMTIAGAYIEAGVRDFSDYAAQMTADFGDRIKPYLLSFWEGARNYPGLDTEGMTPTDEATRLHKALVTELPREEAAALGQELAPPKKRAKKTGRAGDRTLIQDFGVDSIDGWSYDGEGQETDFGVKGGVKDNFLRDATAYLNAVAGVLKEQGYAPSDDARGRPSKPVSKSESGPATSGDVSMTVWNPDTGIRIYAHITGSALRGMVPSTQSGVSIMFRVGLDTDRYATRATNQWAPVDLAAADLAALMGRAADRLAARGDKPLSADEKQRVITELKAEIARPALEPVENGNDPGTVQPELESQSGNRVGPDAGGAALRPQPDAARADSERLADRQPSDVEAPAAGGRGRPAGSSGATADVGGAGQSDLFGDAGDGRARAGRAQPSDAGAGERTGGTGTDLVTVKSPESVSPANQGPGNFHIDDPLAIVGGGQVARFEKNKAAIELANTLREEGRQATREEQTILAGYTGWGSFGQDLFQGTWSTPRPKAGWEARDAWLRDNLGQADWEGLQRSITNAHYTDPPTVLAMWDMVERMGFTGGRVLEPSMGIGNFFGMMPRALKDRSTLTGIELDPTTGAMAQLLYPDANISVMGYQDSKTPDNFYDLVIGNWPFEDTVIADRRYNRLSPFLHDYFYLKALDQVRPGGLVMGITSKGTLDKKDSGIRSELAKKAELVAAFRLPSGAFQDYAGTNVVTDIIVLRKRAEALGNSAGTGWIKSVPYMTPQGEEVSVNEYYLANPSHVVGQIEFGSGTTFRRPGLIVTRPDDMMAQMKRITALVPEEAYQADSRAGKQISYITNHTDDREGALVKSDKGLFIVRGEHLAPAADVAKYEVKDAKVTASRVAQLEALIDMRKAYAALIAAERNADDNPEPARKALKAQYDGFVAAHGTLSDSYGLGYLSKIDDPFYPALAALEVRDGKGVRQATILSQSTVRAARKIDKPTVSDAFVLARNSAINPSLEQIAEIAQKPAAEVKAELIEKGAVFELPGGDIVPADIYLSGNVREKMRQALAARDAGDANMQRNIDALAKVMPADVPYYAIEVQMGASWVPTRTYADYVAHMLNGDSAGVQVHYTAGRWRISIDNALKSRPEASAGFGTPVYSFQKLVNAAISNQTVTIRKEDHEGNVFVDEQATSEANEKIANIRSSFGEWLWSDLDRRVALEAEYNEVRNAYASPSFDGSFLSFEGMALSLGKGPFDLREHQANAIWRGLVMRRSLNAHEVGTGKTFTMGGLAVESRRYGIARKPLIFAHNANSASVAAEIQQMYPASKVLYIDNLAPAQIDVKMRQIANDDWDAVVVPHSLISRFALTEETLMALAAEEIAAIEAEAYAAAEDDGAKLTDAMLDDDEQLKKLRSPTAKDLVKMRNRIIETIKKQGQRASKDGAVSFEDLGVDMVLVDEVHEFKKPPFSTRMRIKGLNTQSSDRSIALSFLLRYIRGQQNGGNVHLFTGTPVTNTLTEVFHAMRYIMAEEMGEVGVDQWDGWFGSFAREVQDVELNAAAEYEAVNRLAGFINVPELRRMIGQYMDVVFADDMPEMQPRRTKSGKVLSDASLTEKERAELLNGRTEDAKDRPYKKVIVETADLTPAQQDAFAKIQGYAQRWRKMTGKEKREVMQQGGPESPIVTEGLAAKASFDVRLMDGEALAGQEGRADDEPNSKASRVVRNVLEIYRSHKQATQVIFTNAGISTTGTRSVGEVGAKTQQRFKVFSTVGDIVERLVQDGIPRDQIAVVDGSTSKEKRKEVADAMNRAEIRVVIGSTQSLGVGVNMQRNLRAMHHMDAPWMPGDLEQRNGRGMRQGNQWNTVLEYRYLTDRIDGRRWQVLAIKQRFINAFLKADDTTRVIEGDAASDEESDILTTFAEAAGDPRVLIREKLRKKIDQLNKKRRLHDTGIVDARRSAEKLDKWVEERRADQRRLAPVAEKVAELSKTMTGDGFAMTIEGQRFDKRSDARDALEELIENGKGVGPGMDPRHVGVFGGHPLEVRWARLSDTPRLTLVIDGEAIAGNLGTIASLEARLRNYSAELTDMGPQIADAERSSARLRAQAQEPFHQAKDLDRAENELIALEKDLAENPVPPPAWLRSGAPIDTEVQWNGSNHIVSGHRWNSEGWFVLASGDEGVIEMPYAEVRDAQGMALYEEREFAAPEVVEKAETPEGRKHSVGRSGRQSIEAVRAALRRGGMGNLAEALEAAGRLTIIETSDAGEGVQAWTDPDGSITLVADQIGDDPVAVLLHEAFHSGAHDLLGGKEWGSLMLRLAGLYRQFEQSKGKARDFFDAARARVSQAEAVAGALGEGLRVEEFAAYAIEEQASAPAALSKWVDDLLGAIKAWALRRFGRQLGAVTPAQLKAIAKAALSAAAPDGGPRPAMASRRRSIAARTTAAAAKIDKQSIIDAVAGKLTDLKPAALAAVPLNYFTELKRPGMVAVDQYMKVKRQMDAYRGGKHAEVDAVAQDWRKYARLGLAGADKTGRARAAALADLMHETTLAGIDPSLTDEETSSKPGYDALRARYLALPRSGQELYRKVRNTYRDQADELDMILLDNVRKTQEIAFRRAEDKYRERLDEIARSKMSKLDKSRAEAEAQRTYSQEMGKATYNMKARMTKLRMAFEASKVPAPYFPLARFGQYFVTVRDIEGNVLSFSRRESDTERRKLERDMKGAYPNHQVESGLMADKSSARDMMDPRIVAEIETLLGDASVDPRVMDMIWQRYLETMPDLSARKRFIHRKGVAGFDGDALRTFASNQFHAAHQMARLKYGLELSELTNQAVDQAKKADDPVRGMQLANELKKRHDWVMNPTGSRAVQAVTSSMFVWYLAASPAAALINMAQTPMMAMPILGARLGGLHKAAAAIGRASADVMRGKGSAVNAKLTEDEQWAMTQFYSSGMIDRTQAHDLAGVGEVGVAYSPVRQKVMSVISWAYHNVEVWNREVTALAAYRLAREQGHHQTKAVDIAHELTWMSHFDYSNASRARLMQGDFAKVVLTFQSHQLNMWYRLFRDIHQSFKGETAQARKEARYQLAGVMGMTGLFAGASGFFGYNVLMAILGLAFDDDDDPRGFKDEFEGHIIDLLGKDLGGIVLNGAPGHLTGIDLTTRLGMPDFFVRAPDGGAEGRDWFQELIVGAMGVVPSTMLNVVDGVGLAMSGNVVRGAEMVLPKALKDLMQAYRYASEGVLTRRGDVTLDRSQVNALDVLIEAIGFTPAKVAETYERMGALKDAEQKVLDERRALMNQFALAVALGDPDARRAAIEAIKAWNRKPYARMVPITGDSLTQSLKSRARNAAKRQDGVLIPDPELNHYLRELMPEHLY